VEIRHEVVDGLKLDLKIRKNVLCTYRPRRLTIPVTTAFTTTTP
jgi:hypothetical protein